MTTGKALLEQCGEGQPTWRVKTVGQWTISIGLNDLMSRGGVMGGAG